VLLFILVSTLNQFAVRAGRIYIDFNLNWNWEGKILSAIISIIFIFASKKYLETITYEDYKISFRHRGYAKRAVFFCAAALVVILIIRYFMFNDTQAFNIETLLFQATIPGLDEELCFRGIYLALLNLAFTKRTKFLGAEFGLGLIITSIQFGLAHALLIGINTGFTFNIYIFVYTAIIGFILGLLAESTKSLILPIASHNGYNVVSTLISMFR
jgi:membrane protease YdiL (CAAX protease family)